MRIVALTDLHGDVSRVSALKEELEAADVVILAGDLTQFGGEEAAEQVVGVLREHALRILAVPGNCDRSGVDAYLEREGMNLHARAVTVGGLGFLGVGGSLPCPGRTPNEAGEDAFARLLESAHAQLPADTPFVLVCHQPPARTKTDLVGGARHVGSESVRAFIERRKPLAVFTGHIHEATGLDEIGPTRIANPGPLGTGGYACAVVGPGVETLEIRRIDG